jgi:hypothetical protein
MRATLIVTALLTLGCERSAPPHVVDSPRALATDSASDSSPTGGLAGWRDEAGPFLAIPDDSLTRAMVITGIDDSAKVDSVGIANTVAVDAFTPAGRAGTALLVPSSASSNSNSCLAWPTARIRQASGMRMPAHWNVGFLAGHVLPSPMDSLAGLTKTDSAHLVSEIARLASTVPNDTALMFRGLPFRVETAYRIRVSDTEQVFIATVVRNINQEADARAEHLLLVASRPSAQRGAQYTTRYFERSSGPEETLETTEVLATVLVGPEQTPSIVIGRSDDAGVAFSLLERDARGDWTLRWSSPFNDC